MPVDWSRYPKDWKQIRARILERAGNKCEECGVFNHSWIRRCCIDPAQWHYSKPKQRPSEVWCAAIMVVLTISHTDHDTTNNDSANLRALCQRCHLLHDREHHAANAARNRDRKRGQTVMELDHA